VVPQRVQRCAHVPVPTSFIDPFITFTFTVKLETARESIAKLPPPHLAEGGLTLGSGDSTI
jgi:hypothetical protein